MTSHSYGMWQLYALHILFGCASCPASCFRKSNRNFLLVNCIVNDEGVSATKVKQSIENCHWPLSSCSCRVISATLSQEIHTKRVGIIVHNFCFFVVLSTVDFFNTYETNVKATETKQEPTGHVGDTECC